MVRADPLHRRFVVISGAGATTGGLPLQENKSALMGEPALEFKFGLRELDSSIENFWEKFRIFSNFIENLKARTKLRQKRFDALLTWVRYARFSLRN